jgi:putative transposase
MNLERSSYPRHRFPVDIISHAVRLYHVISRSLRDVEPILTGRGIVVTHESIRHWCLKFGVDFAGRQRRLPAAAWRHLAPRRGVHPHPRRLALSMAARAPAWRRAGHLGARLAERRSCQAFFKRVLHGLKYKPRRLVTDGLHSYGVAHRAVLPDVRHRTSRYLNNRAENSHRPTRRRGRRMQLLESPGRAQQFLSTHAMIYGHLRLPSSHGCGRLSARSRQSVPHLATRDLRPSILLIP